MFCILLDEDEFNSIQTDTKSNSNHKFKRYNKINYSYCLELKDVEKVVT